MAKITIEEAAERFVRVGAMMDAMELKTKQAQAALDSANLSSDLSAARTLLETAAALNTEAQAMRAECERENDALIADLEGSIEVQS